MISRSFIYSLHRAHDYPLSRHARLSANILSRLTSELDKHPLPYKIDVTHPYHLIVHCNRAISIYAGGFDNRIDIMPLGVNGRPLNAKYERSFMTPIGAVNYILRKYGVKQCH